MHFEHRVERMPQVQAMGERAARELALMAQRGEIEDLETYLADPEFMASLFEMPARAAVLLQKERKARTRRLIQMGAVLESVFPEVQTMELDDVKKELKKRLNA